MHYVDNDRVREEQVQYIEENQRYPAVKTWVNLNTARTIEVVQVGFNYYVKVTFSPYEYYFINSFDCEKAAKKYVEHLLN